MFPDTKLVQEMQKELDALIQESVYSHLIKLLNSSETSTYLVEKQKKTKCFFILY